MACEYSATGSLSVSGLGQATPHSVSLWFRVPDTTTNRIILTTTSAYDILAAGAVTGDPLRVRRNNDTTTMADTTTGYSASTWQHALVVCNSTTDHRIYLNGGGKGTGSVLQGTNVAGISFGFSTGTCQWAEIAAWNVALNDDEALALAAGYSPMTVRRNGIIYYMPLIREQKERRGLTVTVNTSSPAVYDHPRMIYSRKRSAMFAIPPVNIVRSATNILSLSQSAALTELQLSASSGLVLGQSTYPPERTATAESTLALSQLEQYNNNAQSDLALTQSALLPEVVRSVEQSIRFRQLVRARCGNIASGRYRR